MKKLLSVVLLVCIIASFCTVSAYAEEILPKAAVEKLNVNALPGKFEAPSAFSGPLTYAYSFSVDMEHLEQNMEALEKYVDWTADFILTLDNLSTDGPVLFDETDSSADAYLSGQYGGWGGSGANYDDSLWVHIPTMGYSVSLYEGQGLPIMATIIETVDEILGDNFRVTCGMIAEMQTFNCGVHFREEFLTENPLMTVSLSLWITSPDGETTKYITGMKITPDPDILQDAVNKGSATGETIKLPESVPVSTPISVSGELNLELENGSVSCFQPSGNVGSIFKLEKDAVVRIQGEFTDNDIIAMRELVDDDYCVSRGSIIVRASHDIQPDGSCKYCKVKLAAPNPYAVPSTADNSNMPVWTVLFIGFAAVVLLTGKKKKA